MDQDWLAKLRVFLVGLGSLCIVAGAVIALYLAWLIFQLVENPQGVALVGFIIESGGKSLAALQGDADGQPFNLTLGQPTYTLLMLLVGAFFLMAAAGAAKALMAAGVNVVRAGLGLPETPGKLASSNSLRPGGLQAHK